MSTSLFDAKPYDAALARRKRNRIITAICIVVLLAILAWWFRFWSYEHKTSQFFSALQEQNYEKAYGLWMSDPNWKQHPEKYKKYPFGEFYLDWGPSGDWGLVKTFKVDAAINPDSRSSGVVVVVTVNGRAEQACVWVEKNDKTMSYPPQKAVTCR